MDAPNRRRHLPRLSLAVNMGRLASEGKNEGKRSSFQKRLHKYLGLYSVAFRYTLKEQVSGLIATIKHKGLRRLYEKNDRTGIRPDLVEKAPRILSALEAANDPEEMALPMFRFHPLTGDRRGTYSVTVKANWRVTFRFQEGAAYDVQLEDCR